MVVVKTVDMFVNVGCQGSGFVSIGEIVNYAYRSEAGGSNCGASLSLFKSWPVGAWAGPAASL